jgi:hypothetical protein
MSRIFLLVVIIGVLLLGVGVVVLGTFPPSPVQKPVDHVLPNDRFQPQAH